jgi:hypothetical protein
MAATAEMFSPAPSSARSTPGHGGGLDAGEDELFAQIQQELLDLSPGTIQRDLGLPSSSGGACDFPQTPTPASRNRSVAGGADDSSNDDESTKPPDAGQAELAEGQRVAQQSAQQQEAVCAICLEPVDEVEQQRTLVVRTNCGHEFHLACLKRNREFSHTCPMCREPLAQGLTPASQHACDDSEEGAAVLVAGSSAQEAGDETPEQWRSVSAIMADIRDGVYADF